MKTSIISVLAAVMGGVVTAPVSFSSVADAQVVTAAASADTATVRLHVSGMTCGSCSLTARKALSQLEGVYGAKVTYSDSLAVVRFDPRRVTPAQIASHLTKMTGYGARVLPDGIKVRKS